MTDTDIVNLALTHLGTRTISSLTNDRSPEAIVMRLLYEVERDNMLREFPWAFSRRFADLGLVEEDPTDEWAYSYRYPSDALMIRRFLSERNETRQTRIPHVILGDDTGGLLYTDEEDAAIEYTSRITDTQKFTTDFCRALGFRLAYLSAPKLTAGDPYGLGNRAYNLYREALTVAQSSNINEQQEEEPPNSELQRARE